MSALPAAPGPAVRGFSLTELLIALLVIVLLFGLLSTAATRVRASAESETCLSNQRQIYLATLGYLGDNRNRLPAGYYGTSLDGTGNPKDYLSYDDQLADYDGRLLTDRHKRMHPLDDPGLLASRLSNLYRCPAEKLIQKDPAFIGGGNIFVRTYAINRAAVQNGSVRKGVFGNVTAAAGATCWSAHLNEIRNPATTIYLAELRYVYGRVGSSLGEYVDNPYSGPTEVANATGLTGQLSKSATGYFIATQPLHGKRWNYLFVDGHAASLTPESTLGPGTATNQATDADSLWWR